MAFYIKVTREVADKLGVAGIRNSTADGNGLFLCLAFPAIRYSTGRQ